MRATIAAVLALVVGTAFAGLIATAAQAAPARPAAVWPAQGQAAYVLGAGPLRTSAARQRPVPIASVAKVMTALVVLRADPLDSRHAGITIVVTRRDVDDTTRRAAQDQSIVPVRRGEVLTERQALAALLLPSANNMAVMLARRVSGSVGRFVDAMNTEAARLHLTGTRYTDPSGFDARTVSTAADQTVLAENALRIRFLADLVDRSSYRIPVAGVVHNYDTLLGHDGFVGVKTGSDDAAGGCFVFRTYRVVDGRVVTMTGAVLGQRGNDLIAAGLGAARRLVDRVAPDAAA